MLRTACRAQDAHVEIVRLFSALPYLDHSVRSTMSGLAGMSTEKEGFRGAARSSLLPRLARKPLFTLEPCLWVRPRAARRRDKRFELEPRRHRSSGTTRLAGWCFLPPKTPRSRDKPPPHHVLSPILSSTSTKQPIEEFPYSIAIRPIPRRHGRWGKSPALTCISSRSRW